MPTTRTGPGSRAASRASGWGSWCCLARLVWGLALTSTRPSRTRTWYAGTTSASKPRSPSPRTRWKRHWCHGHTTYSPSSVPWPSGPPAWLQAPWMAPNTPST